MASQKPTTQGTENPSFASVFTGELLASVVVFLVALPLCMGIAIASGVPPAMGILTGIVGGLFVGFIAGQPLQVSGPAAGLAVMVYQMVADFGLTGMAAAVALAGVLQVVAGYAKLGRWFRAVSPSVIQGMLAGIGVLIFASQFHVMVDDKPRGSGLQNLLAIPDAIMHAVSPAAGAVNQEAAAIGVLTIVTLLAWNKFKPKALKALPAPLLGVVVASVAAGVFKLPISFVSVPDNFIGDIKMIPLGDATAAMGQASFWFNVLGIAVIASAETLLCATAVDRMHHGQRTNYDTELRAQGFGNVVCGLFGALPMTGVIVRSSANVEAGAKTKYSAILHGAWILLLVAVAPGVLKLIPTASLAAILVFTGYRLFNHKAAIALAKRGKGEFITWAVTVVMIVSADLLVGVACGLGLALLRLIHTLAHLEVRIETSKTSETSDEKGDRPKRRVFGRGRHVRQFACARRQAGGVAPHHAGAPAFGPIDVHRPRLHGIVGRLPGAPPGGCHLGIGHLVPTSPVATQPTGRRLKLPDHRHRPWDG